MVKAIIPSQINSFFRYTVGLYLLGLKLECWCMSKEISNQQKYIQILDDNLWSVIVRHFADGVYTFQDDNAPVHRSRVV